MSDLPEVSDLALIKAIREAGGVINRHISPDQLRCWKKHPKAFPKSYKRSLMLLWNSYCKQRERRQILCLSWSSGRLLISRISVYDILDGNMMLFVRQRPIALEDQTAQQEAVV